MRKKELEFRLQIQDNNIRFLTEQNRDLMIKIHDLENTVNVFFKTKTPNELRANVSMESLNKRLHINLHNFTKNRCPNCGGHDLSVEFKAIDLSSGQMCCNACGHRFAILKSKNVSKSAFEQNDILRDEIKELKDELERARDRIKAQNSKIAILENDNSILKADLDGWKKGPYSYLKEICDKQQAKIKTLEAALEVLFDKFDLESENLGDHEIINNLSINASGISYDKDSGYKTLVNLNNKEFTTLIEAWNIIRKNK